MDWADITALPQPPADATLPYGVHRSQYGELRLPKGPGPHPVVVFIHGGCWSAEYGLDHVRNLAGAITRLGFATWSIEYRRLGESGGGWPGTFLDVGAAIDHLSSLAKSYPLNLARVTVAGHSAGGQLALWAAGRPGLDPASDVASVRPLPVHAVVGLAAIADVASYALGQGSCNASARQLLGGVPREQPNRYRDASPKIDKRIRIYLVHGASDQIVPMSQAKQYKKVFGMQGTEVHEVAGAGHFDVIAPTSPAWAVVAQVLKQASGSVAK